MNPPPLPGISNRLDMPQPAMRKTCMPNLLPIDQREGFRSAALDGSAYLQFMIDSKYPIVLANFSEDGKLLNGDELTPHHMKIIPDQLTVYTEEWEERDIIRLNRESRCPSEQTFFVYAFNKAGALIHPLQRIPSSPLLDHCPYSIHHFTQYWNPKRIKILETVSETPILVANDLDTNTDGSYNQSAPLSNPPHALMVRGISAGTFSISVHAKLNPTFHPGGALQGDAYSTCSVEVIEGYENVDALKLECTVTGKLTKDPGDARQASLTLTKGETVELKAVGLKHRNKWDGKNYKPLPARVVGMPKVNWSFDPSEISGAATIDLEDLHGNGRFVRITAVEAGTASAGKLRIYGQGKVWAIDVRVNAVS